VPRGPGLEFHGELSACPHLTIAGICTGRRRTGKTSNNSSMMKVGHMLMYGNKLRRNSSLLKDALACVVGLNGRTVDYIGLMLSTHGHGRATLSISSLFPAMTPDALVSY
jgi:hypothetical protein